MQYIRYNVIYTVYRNIYDIMQYIRYNVLPEDDDLQQTVQQRI